MIFFYGIESGFLLILNNLMKKNESEKDPYEQFVEEDDVKEDYEEDDDSDEEQY